MLKIFNLRTGFKSLQDHKYKIGEIVEVKNFDDRFWVECAPGIYFFMNRDDAVKY